MVWPAWAGDVPTWITTVAVVLAALQFVHERDRRRSERDREAKAQASRLTAWVAINLVGDERRSYGVVVSNTSGSTFHDVTLTVTIHDGQAAPITMAILPPGTYYVRHRHAQEKQSTGKSYDWAFAEHVDVVAGTLRPYMKSEKYQLIEIRFSDNLNQRWVSDSYAVLSRAD